MLEALATSAGFGFIAGIMPGPLQTFLLLQTFQRGARGGAWVVPAPLFSDGPIILVCLLILSQAGDGLLRGLALCGGLFLVYLAVESFKGLRAAADPLADATQETLPAGWRTTARAVMINGLGPGPWIFWGTVMGPLLVQEWRLSPARGFAFLGAFYGTLLLILATLLLLFAFARRLGPRIVRGGTWVGLVLLGVFAALLILYGLGVIERYGL